MQIEWLNKQKCDLDSCHGSASSRHTWKINKNNNKKWENNNDNVSSL